MDNGKVDWRGCFPACVTPFTKSGDIDEKKFVANLELMMDEGAGVMDGGGGEPVPEGAEVAADLGEVEGGKVGGYLLEIGAETRIGLQLPAHAAIVADPSGTLG